MWFHNILRFECQFHQGAAMWKRRLSYFVYLKYNKIAFPQITNKIQRVSGMSKIQKMLMTETFAVKGKWFLAESEMENSVDGILNYSPQKIELDLIGSFYDPFLIQNLNRPQQITIYGFSEQGEWYTLLGCVPSKMHMNAPGFDSISYIVNWFYVGTRIIQSETDNIVERARFSFTNIDAWLKYSVLEVVSKNDHRRTECIIDMDSPRLDRGSFAIPQIGLSLNEELEYNLEFPKDYFLNEKREINLNRFFRFVPLSETSCSLKKMADYMHQLRRLLTLLVGTAMYFKYVDFDMGSSQESFGDEVVEVKNSCRMFFCQVGDIGKTKHLLSRDLRLILLKREDLQSSMEIILNRWYKEQERLGEIINPYVSDLYLPAYMENKFLSIVKGLETYHRFFCKSSDEGVAQNDNNSNGSTLEADKNKLITYITESISPQNQEYFVEKICYKSEMNLRRRLKELFAQVPESLMSCCFGKLTSDQRNKLFSKIVDTRNYYTHRDKKERYPNLINSHVELDHVTKQLSVVLQFFVLAELGVDENLLAQRLSEKIQNQF